MKNLKTIISLRKLANSVIETKFTKKFKKLSKKKKRIWRKNIIEAKKYLRDSEKEYLNLFSKERIKFKKLINRL